MLLEWKTSHQGWRWRTSSSVLSSSQMQSIPWLILVVFLQTASVLGSAYPPPPSVVQQMQQGASQSHLTGPSSNIPNYVYQIDGRGDKLVQRQVQQQQQQQPLPSGLTAAATNYLLQQLQLEKLQQQQRQLQATDRSGHPAMGIAPNSPQAQTLQLLAGLTPQQLAALQAVLPQARANSQHQQQQPQVASSGSSTAPVIVPAPESMQQQHLQGFSPRMGPFDKIINKAKAWLPEMMGSGSSIGGGSSKSSSIGEPKMRDMHRLPKPPKYPLYDMGSIGLATPPPAPIMHPMASLPNNAFDWDQASNPSTIPNSSPRSTYNQHQHQHQHNWMSPSPTSSTSRRSRPAPRPPKPSKSSFLRSPFGRKPRPSAEPPHSHNRRNHSPPPPPPRGQPPRQRGRNPPPKPQKKGGPPRGRYPPPPRGNRPPTQSGGPTTDPYTSGGPSGPNGFEHPMASNLSPAQSPSLGRPLNYDEYMARPSHSYTDDPWNFDPFANQMNQGLHTHALRYNYDPLGMNALDTEANSHLDPNKLSYPGDSFNQDMVKDTPGIGGTAQIGGWDKPYRKRPFGDSEPQSELTPPPGSGSPYSGSSSFSSSPQDPYTPPSSSGRYKNRDSQDRERERERERDSSRGSGYVNNGALSGGRRGDFPMDSHDSESSYRGHENNDRGRNRYDGGDMERSRYDNGDRYEGGHRRHHQNQHDDAPTIDLETLSRQQEEDGMSGLEFTIETSRDTAAAARNEESDHHDHEPTPHPLGPMQPASDPFLSDQYNPYGEHSSPGESTIPGTPYGPNGFRERYGRRKTRNNHNGSSSATARTSSQRYRARARAYYQQKRQQQQRAAAVAAQAPVAEKRTAPVSSATAVPEGVQIFNDIIRPQLQLTSSSSSSSSTTTGGSSSNRYGGQRRAQVHPNQEALRRSLYNAIRQQASSKK